MEPAIALIMLLMFMITIIKMPIVTEYDPNNLIKAMHKGDIVSVKYAFYQDSIDDYLKYNNLEDNLKKGLEEN